MKYTLLIVSLIAFNNLAFSQNKTDISLYLKENPVQVSSIESETGDLYQKAGHHGPAIENEWLGLRLYFDYKVAIDVYNKVQPQLELADAKWYPTPEQQKEGWGADYYKAGTTVGLGGVRLWDGEKAVFLNPVSKRTARVKKEANQSYMEMLSEGIPYKDDTIAVLVRVTVFSGMREAKVEAFAFSSKPVQFLTGINYHEGTKTKQTDNYICTWGLHPEDVAAVQMNIGGVLFFNPDDYQKITKEEKEYQLISKPTNYISTWISSACEKEKGLSSMEDFIGYIERVKP